MSPINLTKEDILSLAYKPPRVFCAVYFLIKGDEIVYIGQSKNFPRRVRAHILKKKIDFDKYFHVECYPWELKELEKLLILKHTPKMNRDLFLKKHLKVKPEDLR